MALCALCGTCTNLAAAPDSFKSIENGIADKEYQMPGAD